MGQIKVGIRHILYQNGAEHAIAFAPAQALKFNYLRLLFFALKLARIAHDIHIEPARQKTFSKDWDMTKAEKKKQKQDRLVQALRDNLKRRKQTSTPGTSPKETASPCQDQPGETSKD
jgi:hypothetical protein|tara:strand:- start:850 stop:1203 length:354 start_codon:yes stop_codon:yes gene_type:complete